MGQGAAPEPRGRGPWAIRRPSPRQRDRMCSKLAFCALQCKAGVLRLPVQHPSGTEVVDGAWLEHWWRPACFACPCCSLHGCRVAAPVPVERLAPLQIVSLAPDPAPLPCVSCTAQGMSFQQTIRTGPPSRTRQPLHRSPQQQRVARIGICSNPEQDSFQNRLRVPCVETLHDMPQGVQRITPPLPCQNGHVPSRPRLA